MAKKLIQSPKGCKKRHERVKFWMDVIPGKYDGNFRLNILPIDWDTITLEDRIILGLIEEAIQKGSYSAYVALANSRYGMLKGGDYVDDGSDDEVTIIW